ncbi:MAG: YaiI/YqxD family protein [bacterium]
MRLLVDADSMPPRVRSIIARAASRYDLEAVFVANRSLPLPREGGTMIVCDDADAWIAEAVREDDLAVTRDVPLAARIVERGAEVITDRGEHYTSENIGPRLSEREFAMRMRDAGEIMPAGRPYGSRELSAFANALDRELEARNRGA